MIGVFKRIEPGDRPVGRETPDNVPPEVGRRRALAAIACLVFAIAMLAISLTRFALPPGAQTIDGPTELRVRNGVDPNTAAWYEIAQLPGVGEGLARRIVQFRQRPIEGGRSTDRRFRTASDLTAVKGLGRATAARLRPYLRFEPLPAVR